MSKIDQVIAREGDAAEGVPTPDDGERRNLNRSVMFSMRLNPEELDELQRYADQQDLPARTLARAWILQRLRADDEPSDRLSSRVARLEKAVFPRTA